jgi:hypothetical protein
VLTVPASWRVIATMNVFDKSLLFEMSFALMRRFAFIEVPSPRLEVFEELISREAADDAAASLTLSLLPLREFKDLGPAIYMDIARYLAARRQLATATEGGLRFDAFYSYLLPQFEGIDQVQGEQLHRRLRTLVGPALHPRLRETLNNVLGLELPKPVSEEDTDADSDDLLAEVDEPDIQL